MQQTHPANRRERDDSHVPIKSNESMCHLEMRSSHCLVEQLKYDQECQSYWYFSAKFLDLGINVNTSDMKKKIYIY